MSPMRAAALSRSGGASPGRPGVAAGRWWAVVQALGLTLTAVLLGGLVWAPELTLGLFWKVLIPLVPASLLVSPLLWRNVCPLATLNLLLDAPGGLKQRARVAKLAPVVGIVLLAVMVPARRFLFNQDGTALALVILAVALLAVLLGVLFDAKAGFCAGICPVLPVERLYGQSPLIGVPHARCPACTACAKACIDLAPRSSARRMLGPRRGRGSWLLTPFGSFAAAFPGFVMGYFTLSDASLSQAGAVYLHVGIWTAASWAVVAALALATGGSPARWLPTLGAVAAGLYYWFAAPDLGTTLGLAEAAGSHLRVAALGLVVAWWLGAWLREPRSRAARPVVAGSGGRGNDRSGARRRPASDRCHRRPAHRFPDPR